MQKAKVMQEGLFISAITERVLLIFASLPIPHNSKFAAVRRLAGMADKRQFEKYVYTQKLRKPGGQDADNRERNKRNKNLPFVLVCLWV